jgi:hypothetical protein
MLKLNIFKLASREKMLREKRNMNAKSKENTQRIGFVVCI